MGPNGSGKTTLINVIGGLYKPDSGSVFFHGKEITGLPPHKIFKLGLARTFQIPALFPNLTVLENVMVAKKDNPGESFARSLVQKILGERRNKNCGRGFRSPSNGWLVSYVGQARGSFKRRAIEALGNRKSFD